MITAIRQNHAVMHESIDSSTTKQKAALEKANRITTIVQKRTDKKRSLTSQVIEEGHQEAKRRKVS